MSCAVVPLLSGAAEKQEVPTEPLDLLASLMQEGVAVEVCALFLPEVLRHR